MINAEEKLREWRVLYREWSELERRLQSAGGHQGAAADAELRARARALQQQSASALAELDQAVVAMRGRRQGRENIS